MSEAKEKKTDVLYYCDAFPGIGMGHLKRGIDILHSLHGQNPELSVAIQGKFSYSAMRFIRLFLDKTISVFEPSILLRSRITVLDTMVSPGNAEEIDTHHCNALKNTTEELVLINGALRATIPLSVDLVINHLPDAEIRIKAPQRVFQGFEYAPVTAEFYKPKTECLKKDAAILAVIGGSQRQNGPQWLAEALSKIETGNRRINMVVSPHFPEARIPILLEQFCDSLNLHVYKNLETLIPLFHTSFATVCTYGNSVYESLACRRATFVCADERFQDEFAEYLENKGLVRNIGFFDNLDLQKLAEINNPETLSALKDNAKKQFKFAGIENIARILLSELDHVS